MITLFVGGPKDGKREYWCGGATMQVATFTTLNGPVVPIDQGVVGMDRHIYHLKRFRDEGNTYEVAFHSTIKNPMETLIKGYHYHRNPRYGRSRRIPKIPQAIRAW